MQLAEDCPVPNMSDLQIQIPNMSSIHNILTIIAHPFGHQSGPDESSGRNSTTFLYGATLRVYLMVSKIRKNTSD